MRKFLSLFIFLISFFSFFYIVAGAGCDYNNTSDLGGALKNCIESTSLVKSNDLKIGGNFNNKIYNITKTIATVLSLGAIFGIVYGSFLLVIAGGEEEKIKKGKDVIKWSIIGFLGVVLASSLIVLLVTFFYDIGAK